jgi:hypothetical protein
LFRGAISLNTPLSDDGGESKDELIDLLQSVTNQDVVEQLQAKALLQAMSAKVLELDSVGTGQYGLSYKAIFDSLLTNSLDSLKGSVNCSQKVLDFYVSKLRCELSVVRDAWAV